MKQGILTRVLLKLVPQRFFRQAEEAEAGAEEVKEQLDEVEKKGRRVRSLANAMREDRLENHYADRVRAAYTGKGH